MKVLAITATAGRHWCMERTLGMFLQQDYPNSKLLIYNNAGIDLSLSEGIDTERVILINNNISKSTGIPYTNLGDIYNDCIKYIEELDINPDIITHMDDDDIYFPNHLSKGVEGYIKGNKLAYKPAKSFYHDINGIHLMENVLEPSIFVNYNHIKEYGYFDRNVDLHHKWLQPLIDKGEIFVDIQGEPSFIYDWNVGVPTWKTSGDPHNPNNFDNYRYFSQDNGDRVLTPFPLKDLKKYYEVSVGSKIR